MIDERTGKNLKEFSILDEPMVRIYIFLNTDGKIKIGRTKDIYKRYLSLGGSNGQGIEIHKIYCSSATYLYTLENIMHDKFSRYRIPNTEWFYDKSDPAGEKLFLKAANELDTLFSSAEYEKCNETRKRLNKGGDSCDN
jgi:hypothetical protein